MCLRGGLVAFTGRRHSNGLRECGCSKEARLELRPPVGVRFDDQQVSGRAPGVLGQVVEQPVEHLAVLDRLAEEREAPVGEGAIPGLVGAHHAHRDVARRGILLEPLEHAPAVDVRQVDVQRDRVRVVLAGQRQRRGPERGDQPLEPLLARRASATFRFALCLHTQRPAVAA